MTERERAELDRLLAATTSEPFATFLRRSGMEANPVTKAIGKIVETAAAGEEQRIVIATPPRHGKTDTLLHAFAWLLANNPQQTHAYATYGQELANSKSRRARRLAQDAGVNLDPASTSVKEWRTQAGGGLLATGAGGPLTGQGITGLGVVDDPLKNRQEAESSLIRERVWEWFNDVFYTRLEPGASAVIVATRWHPDDLSGRLIADGWKHITLPALSNDGTALWPDRYPLERLTEIREQVGEYTWASLYQGEPRPRGGTVYQQPTFYDELPTGPYREAHGFDAAYTAKTHADYSVTITGRLIDGRIYVTNMIRDQLEPRHYIAKLQAQGINDVTWFLSGTEKGLVAFLKDQGIRVREIKATGDKFVRAQPSAAAWNAGKILVPKDAPWLDAMLSEVTTFTGLNDAHDDVIDALAALHHTLTATTAPRARIL